MALLDAIVVFVVGYVSGTVTRLFAWVAAVAALVLAILGLAVPAPIYAVVEPVLEVYVDNELLFLSGFLFAMAHVGRRESTAG